MGALWTKLLQVYDNWCATKKSENEFWQETQCYIQVIPNQTQGRTLENDS
jgi:hypothetical protein